MKKNKYFFHLKKNKKSKEENQVIYFYIKNCYNLYKKRKIFFFGKK